MTDIVKLWRKQQLPITQGVYFADGRSYAIAVAHGRLSVVERFELSEMLAKNPNWLHAIFVTTTVAAPGGFACAGETSWGSDNFFARLDEAKELVWVCCLSDSSPFEDLVVTDGMLTAGSAFGPTVTVDLDAPVR